MAFVPGDLTLMENPQGEDGDVPMPRPMHWGWEQALPHEFNSLHAMTASTTAYQCASEATKNTMTLVHWVQYLLMTMQQLQSKVSELEDWKRKALEDFRKLREEQKALRRKVFGDERQDDVPSQPGILTRSKSSPPLESARFESALSPQFVLSSPPPGLEAPPPREQLVAEWSGDKQVRFDAGVRQHMVRGAVCDPLPVQCGRGAAAGTDSEQPSLVRDDTDEMQPSIASLPSGLSAFSLLSDGQLTDGDSCQLEGVHVMQSMVDGVDCERAEWRIGHLPAKLRGCMGRPLVSSAFNAAGLEDLRLMVSAEGKEQAKGPRSRRQKELYAKKVTEGPLEGCLKLKVPNCPSKYELKYYLKVGSVRVGPLVHNFAESTVHGCEDFRIDWLTQMEPDQSLTVCVEIVRDPKACQASGQLLAERVREPSDGASAES